MPRIPAQLSSLSVLLSLASLALAPSSPLLLPPAAAAAVLATLRRGYARRACCVAGRCAVFFFAPAAAARAVRDPVAVALLLSTSVPPSLASLALAPSSPLLLPTPAVAVALAALRRDCARRACCVAGWCAPL